MATKETGIQITPIKETRTTIRIYGDTPLIEHAWSQKAKQMMLDTQTGKKKVKESRKPVEEFIDSMYWLTPIPEQKDEEGFVKAIQEGARFGFPACGFKQAAISAAYRLGWSKDKASLRGVFFIRGNVGDLVEIHTEEPPEMREDMVRVGMGTADLRYRGEFKNWWADLDISYNQNGTYNLETIINLINAGGYVCGVGEWRPEKDGTNGMFHVGESK